MSAKEPRRAITRVAICCAIAVLGASLLSVPRALARWSLSPDSVEYVAAAHNWLHGAGFVDPIVYSYFLPNARPPLPAATLRPPGVSWLFTVPLAFGGGVTAVMVFHAIWASAVAALAVVAARRAALSLPAAFGFAVALTWSPGWVDLSRQPLTEASATAILFLALLAMPGGVTSTRGALGLAALTLLGWLTRPNLGILAPAVVLSVALERGPRAALRSRPLWLYVLSFAGLALAVSRAIEATTGFALYAHYGVMAEIFDVEEVHLYRTEYVGALTFIRQNSDAVASALLQNLRDSAATLFADDRYLRVGYLAIPGLVYALARRGEGSLERRFAALAALGFTLQALGMYGAFDANRFLLPGVVCLWLTAFAFLDAVCGTLAAQWGDPRIRALARGLPAFLAVGLFLTQGGFVSARDAHAAWQGYLRRGTASNLTHPKVRALRSVCPALSPDVLVASYDPWSLYFWCGNAGLRLPQDLESVDWVNRYLDDLRPGYVVVDGEPRWDAFRHAPRLRRIEAPPPLEVYEVRDAGPESRTWVAPPPISAGIAPPAPPEPSTL